VLLANEARGQMALEKFVYVVDRLYVVFDVATSFAHTALESLVYVVDRLYAKFEVVYVIFEVALRDVSVNVDALMTMLEVAWMVPVTSRVYVGLGLRMPTFPPPPWTMNDPPTTLGRSMLRDAAPPKLRGPLSTRTCPATLRFPVMSPPARGRYVPAAVADVK
jgi:hypothetical protein